MRKMLITHIKEDIYSTGGTCNKKKLKKQGYMMHNKKKIA